MDAYALINQRARSRSPELFACLEKAVADGKIGHNQLSAFFLEMIRACRVEPEAEKEEAIVAAHERHEDICRALALAEFKNPDKIWAECRAVCMSINNEL